MTRYKEQEALRSQQQTNCNKKLLQQRLQLRTDASERHSHCERRQQRKETRRNERKGYRQTRGGFRFTESATGYDGLKPVGTADLA